MIDPTTPIGLLRLRVADYNDIPILPDSVYIAVLASNNGSLPQSAKTLSMYILGGLASKVHRKLSTMEVYGSDYFKQYKEFLLLTFTNPNFMDISPIPIDLTNGTTHPLIQFQKDWNLNYSITQSQVLNWSAYGNVDNYNGAWVWPG